MNEAEAAWVAGIIEGEGSIVRSDGARLCRHCERIRRGYKTARHG